MLLVLALTGSALAVTQQRLYMGNEAEAQGVTAVQQHSVFIEIVVEQQDRDKQIHKFAAVVGLIKKCKQVRNAFDNAVLWFNDQFLFGAKNSTHVRNVTPNSSLGYNGDENRLLKRSGETDRWAGCYIPDGFAMAIGADDPFGSGYYTQRYEEERNETDDAEATAEGATGENVPDDNIDLVRRLVDLDNQCRGCIFEYQSSFFITDPNDPDSPQNPRWVVDKLVYPVSILGNLFQEGRDNALREDGCASGNGPTPFSDPRDSHPHQDECSGEDGRSNHYCNEPDGECGQPENRAENEYDGYKQETRNESRYLNQTYNYTERDHEENTTLVEPLFTVHLQVNPLAPTPRGYIDQADWQYPDSTVVDGMPYSQDPSNPGYDKCKLDQFNSSAECSVEYNFLIAVDFTAFDNRREQPGEDELRDDAVQHGSEEFPQDKAWQGNSHPHNPQAADAGPQHGHDTVSLDVFFHEQAPFFVNQHPYWDEYGRPPAFDIDCSDAHPSSNANETRSEAISARSPIVCDTEAQSPYHKHDGTETPADD